MPRVYVASEWPAPERRSAAHLTRAPVRSVPTSGAERPWVDYVNGATLLRTYIAEEARSERGLKAKWFEELQYYIDSAFPVPSKGPWPYPQARMPEASWLRKPISQVSGLELDAFVQAHLAVWSPGVVGQRLSLLDRALKRARQKRGAAVHFSLAHHFRALVQDEWEGQSAA